MKKKVYLLTVIWGEWHIETYLKANIPTLLASRNLPVFSDKYQVRYKIFTLKSDYRRILDSDEFQKIKNLMPVEFEFLSDEQIADPITTQTSTWINATTEAKQKEEYILFIPPDVAWSNGSFETLAKQLDTDKKAIFMTYLRVISDSFISDMHSVSGEEKQSQNSISISGRQMVKLGLKNIHPLIAAYSHDSNYFPHHSEMIVWTIKDEGIMVRLMAREMFLFDPSAIKSNEHLLMSAENDPEDIALINDSDDLFAVSLTEIGKDSSWHLRASKATPINIARWWLKYDSPWNDYISSIPLYWHFDEINKNDWDEVSQLSSSFIAQCRFVREIMRIVNKLEKEKGNEKLISLLTLAMNVLDFEEVLQSFCPALILLPTFKAFKNISEDRIENLYSAENKSQLIEFFISHLFSADENIKETIASDEFVLNVKNNFGDELSITKTEEKLSVDNKVIDYDFIDNGSYLLLSTDSFIGQVLSKLD